MKKYTKKEALTEFKENILPHVVAKYGENDTIAKNTVWHEFIDRLQKEGVITEWQFKNWSNPF